ncbi:MAG: hypothetical protein KKE12_10400 [Proteobacteria bacterium]|nr:hypothetical protein [Pseudomonadota bacterium]
MLPGEEGKIKVVLSTQGYGDMNLKKDIKVHTNDPAEKMIKLMITGGVKRFARLDPGIISLKGVLGKPIIAKMTISPTQDNGFDIARVRVKEGQYIRYNIKKIKDKKLPYYELTVENTRKVPGRFFDLIMIETDTSPKRQINIRVSGYLSN